MKKQRGFFENYMLMALLVAVIVIAGLGFALRHYMAETDRLQAIVDTHKPNEKEVVKYVEKKIYITKRIPVIQRELVRVCNAGMPGSGDSSAGAKTEAGHAKLDALGSEIGDCLAESEQLKSLITVLKPQVRQ